MKIRTWLVTLSLGTLLVGCQINKGPEDGKNDDDTEEVSPDDQTDESDKDEDNKNDKDKENKDDKDTDKDNDNKDTDESNEDSGNGKDNKSSDDVEETNYSSEAEAADAIEDYEKVEDTNTDLGHGIEGHTEGAAGHQYISWNEGNWYIEVDFPSDPDNAVGNYDDGNDLAETIVDYLEDHKLPAPGKKGVIKAKGFSDDPETVIRWQKGSTVYEIKQKDSNPINVIQKAINYEND